jgi:uncharacterized membrane protein YagU involved in acid resistance
MTAVMMALHRKLPPQEPRKLPPQEVTESIAAKAGAAHHLDREPKRKAAATVAHFAFGAAAGAVYGAMAERLPGGPAGGGIAYGLAVWAGNYLGVFPALGVRRPSTEQPPRREGALVAAHVVWGAALGIATSRLHGAER